jgi:hypothetical protein
MRRTLRAFYTRGKFIRDHRSSGKHCLIDYLWNRLWPPQFGILVEWLFT